MVQPATGGRDDLSGRFCTCEGVHQEEYDAEVMVREVCGSPAHQARAAKLKALVEGLQGVTDE